MQKKHWIRLVVILLILGDLGFSFCQYYGKNLDGDLANIIVPAESLAPVLDDPFGFQILKTGEGHAASNRYFAHKTLIVYFDLSTKFFSNFTNSIKAIYLSNALFLWLSHLLILWTLSRFIGHQFKLGSFAILIAALFVFPLFQSNGYHVHMGLISGDISYASAYAFPMGLLLYFFYPFLRRIANQKFEISLFRKIISLPLIVLLAFNGPLIPPVGIIISLLILWYYCYKGLFAKKEKLFMLLQKPSVIYCLLFILVSFYSFYIGTFNTENSSMLSLSERYLAMLKNIFPFVTQKLGLPILIAVVIINTILLKRQQVTDHTFNITKQINWILAFIIIYLLLLPIGGYRSYRSGIIRHDTFIPIAIALIYYFGLTSNYLWNEIKSSNKSIYRIFVFGILLIYAIADKSKFDKNRCQKEALTQLANSKNNPTLLPSDCNILSWNKITDPKYSKTNAQLLQRWNVTVDTVLYYQK